MVGKSYWGVNHKVQIDEFYQDILNGRRPRIDGDEGRSGLVCPACYWCYHRRGGTLPLTSPGLYSPSLTNNGEIDTGSLLNGTEGPVCTYL